MRFFFWHFVLLFFWIIFEVSFLQIIFPNLQAPIVPLALVVSMGMVFSLDRALGMTLISAFLFDITRAGSLTPFFFLALPLVFGTNFVTQRFFAVSRSAIRPQAIVFFVIVLSLYELSVPFFAWPSLWDMILGIVLFPIVFFTVFKLEEQLISSSMLEFRGLRQTPK